MLLRISITKIVSFQNSASVDKNLKATIYIKCWCYVSRTSQHELFENADQLKKQSTFEEL